MKLQISFNCTNLQQALNIAQKTATFSDIIEIGTLLIYKEGISAVKSFRATFPRKTLFANSKISEKAQDSVELFGSAGASMISVLAGIPQTTLKKTIEAAKKFDMKVIIDVFDIQTAGQIALDAKRLGIDAILLHQPPTPFDLSDYTSHWHSIQANTDLPLFITGNIDRSNINQIKNLKPYCVAIGSGIIKAENQTSEAQFFKTILR